MFRRGLVAMTGRILLCVAFVANILVLVTCTETAHATATSASSAVALADDTSSSSSYAWSSSSAKRVVKFKRKCRKATTSHPAKIVAPPSLRASHLTFTDSRSPLKNPSTPVDHRSTIIGSTANMAGPLSLQLAYSVSYAEDKWASIIAKRCPNNEEFSFCPESIQRAQYCSEKAEPSTFRSTSTRCVCKENYLRAENGSCIPAAQCPVTCGANEILDNCPTNCQSDYCPTEEDTEAKSCVRPHVCPPPACKCAFNHRRALNGSCIPTVECPPYACGTNEEYNPCPPLCPTDDCSQASPSGECPPHFGRIGIILPCNPKCRCIKDYWRLDGICVPYGQCPGVCPDNERYSTCTQAECRALNCTQKDKSVACIRMDPRYCKKGCVCKEGYLRNEGGICVLEDKCEPAPSCTSVDEEFVPCIQGVCRAKDCSQKGEDVPCPDIPQEKCASGCICKEHFLRAANGSCVPEDQCEPAPSCASADEEFVPCIQGVCRAKDCSQKGEDVPCPDIPQEKCDSGCICKEHFLRAANGSCVPEDQCEPAPSCASADEEFVPCIQGVCRAKDCSQKGEDVPCPDIPQEKCDSGCICKEHFLRAANGSCVPEDQCEPNLCPINEEWSSCAQATCRAQNCTQKGGPIFCPMIMEGYCEKACVCKENYLRNENGDCVPEDQCPPKTCGVNEVLDNCSLSCNSDNCPQSADEEQLCTQSDPCIPACKCKFNYKRSENGTCIPTRDCPPFDCSAKPNEEYVACPPFCPTDECGKPRLEGRCPFIIGTFLQCNPKCQCKDGYGRVNGTCVPFDKCPGLCPANEVYSSCVQQTCRQQNCSDRDVVMKNCPSCDEASCQRGCVCQENHYRNATGVCVPYAECEAPKTCGENEVLDNCPMKCNTDNCPRSADEKQVCTQADPCVPACKCRFNYRRAENGTCIPTRDCPPFDCSAKPNEKFVACPPLCPSDECGKPRIEGRCPYKIGILLNCNPKCQCKDGYGRANGTCVPFEQCPGLCATNQVYSACVQKTCRQQKCSDRDLVMESCPSCDEASCKRGCVCQENYYRNDKGDCVSYEECRDGVCPDNERYSTCTQAECRALNCTQKDKSVPCIRMNPQFCKKGCVCEEGYLRNEHGICVLEDKCEPAPSCTSADEEFVPCIQGVCRAKDCSQKGEDGPCPDIPQEKCDSGCICKEHFLRAANGSCVPEDQCEPNLCPINEEWSTCAQATCRAQNCTQKGGPIFCPMIMEGYCEKACVCKENYLRKENGDCVPEDQCPPKTCGVNEVLDNCSLSCNSDNCPQSAEEEQLCIQSDPCIPACKCKFNYKRSDNGTCIPTRECPPFDCSAKPNEEYVACPPFCPTDECGKPRLEGRCPFIIGTFLQCNPKCQCKDGYGRVNGTCVPFDKCPGLCPANEVYSSCVQQTCRQQNCSDRDVVMKNCPSCDEASCQRGCVCQENHYRNATGVCVPYAECEAPKTCGENEVLDNCPMKCNSDNCPRSADEKQVCSKADPCVPACKCRFNYRRAENGTCIPTRDCPPFDCSAKPNEKFVACPPLCPSDECGKPRIEGRCPFKIGILLNCNPKCQCKDGYGRANGTCVPFEQCPGLCATNQVYSACVQKTCRQQKCSDRDLFMESCPSCDEASCKRGCVCQENYYRNDKGDCVSYEECGGPMCPNAHEEYTPNFKECPPNTCRTLVERISCAENQIEGPGCVCSSGYLRINVTSPCIPICDCPEMKYSIDC